jgi:tetratricopeptide (TPR) repeat protein
MASKFAQALARYTTALSVLEQAISQATPEQILEILLARDVIATLLKDKTLEPIPELVSLAGLDLRLKKHAIAIATQVKLPEWRASFQPSSEAWWWFFAPPLPAASPWEWFRNVLSAICVAVALGLLLDIAPRFLSGGPDTWGAFAVIGQSLLTLLTAGGALTKAGQEGLERLLTHLTIPKTYYAGIKFGVTLIILGILLAFRLALPAISIGYNNNGLANYQAGHFASALSDYQRALKLNPDYAEAHYNLGLLYEDLQDLDQAKIAYQLAARSGLDAAYNNLARLYIREKKYTEAVPLLLAGQDQAQDNEVRYDLLKNLGWARLGQGRYAEAGQLLQEAIALTNERAPAHCLLAQVLEAQTQINEARTEWEQCLAFASSRQPDEDAWIGMARERLSQA